MSMYIKATVRHTDHRGYGAAPMAIAFVRIAVKVDSLRIAIAWRGFVRRGSRRLQLKRHHGCCELSGFIRRFLFILALHALGPRSAPVLTKKCVSVCV